MHKVYVLKSEKDGNFYIGCTSNIEKRIYAHNSGRVKSTKARRPLSVVFVENYESKHLAYKMERYYKTATGKRKLKEKI